MNMETLLDNVIAECENAIRLYAAETGEHLDVSELSDEEDADIVQDNLFRLQMLMVSNPVVLGCSQRWLSASAQQKKK